MILSMTGFGRASGSLHEKNITIEIRSLNGKMTDLRLKLPNYYKEKEIELRKIILDDLVRGKVDANLNIDSEEGDFEYGLNKNLFKKYYKELYKLKTLLNMEQTDLMQSILRIPNVIQNQEGELTTEEWEFVSGLTQSALKKLNQFRSIEGKAMQVDLTKSTVAITELLKQIDPYESERLKSLKEKLQKSVSENLASENVDANRFEQEILYYLEKLDINEEKVRLAQHCQYFIDVLESNSEKVKGKKLGFISQEMGREINTMGAKAQHSHIQRIVVEMKDELEKIKEQIANIV